ncbi:MAG: AAA family ATPase [Clostridia bacterium]|nr:AAA family ATPase [Clostridia bacterium]
MKPRKVPGQYDKIPCNPHVPGKYASVADPDTWGTFEDAAFLLSRPIPHFDGIGFMLGEGIFAIDLDHVRDKETGLISEDATKIIETMNSYTEISPSGTGIHILCRGTLPEGQRRHGFLEMYETDRFLTITGDHLEDTPLSVEDRTEQAALVHSTYMSSPSTKNPQKEDSPRPPVSSSVDRKRYWDLISIAGKAKNGDKVMRLFSGNTEGYSSSSEADLALCNMLAFYAGDDESLVDEAFRASGLMRPKWDEKRGTLTYGQKTLQKALEAARNSSFDPDKFSKGREMSTEKKDSQSGSKEKIPTERKEPAVSSSVDIPKGTGTLYQIATEERYVLHEQGRVSTGIAALDEKLHGGIRPGFLVIGGEPGTGKTSFALQLCDHALSFGAKVLYISYEQPQEVLAARMLAGMLSSGGGYRGKTVTVDMIRSGDRKAAVEKLVQTPERHCDQMEIRDSREMPGVEEVLGKIRGFAEHARAQKPDQPVFVVLDYLQMVPFSAGDSLRLAINDFVRELRKLQAEHNLYLVVLSAVNRSTYGGPVRLDSFRETGGIEFGADIILALNLGIYWSDAFLRAREGSERTILIQNARMENPKKMKISCLKNKEDEADYGVDAEFIADCSWFR